ncbi:unnamed protein product [Discosporangium mesarthrocarpum]
MPACPPALPPPTTHYPCFCSADFDTDLLVLGCGMAGASSALKAAQLGMRVTMLSASQDPSDCNSYWAQGGIIYRAEDDSPELLASDVHAAGAGICNHSAVMKLAKDGPGRVEELLLTGPATVPFDKDPSGSLALCLEASHNRARIIHWRDQTGKAITDSVQQATLKHPNIQVVTSATAVDLSLALRADRRSVQCVGAHVLVEVREREPNASVGGKPKTRMETVLAPATVLATGGLGDLYAHTSNPASSRGAGFAMALRAGAALSNMEYVQFHPTTLHTPHVQGERSFLLTEALRGEGARLVDSRGRAFAQDYHPDGELAPRDVVSRMIMSEIARQGTSHMYLDISHRDPNWLAKRFPGIDAHCRERGLDMAREPLPVVPAAHYFCGGVTTDLEGRTSVPGLFAAGEVACTGLHGANRLASTSLLEGLVWGCDISDNLFSRPSTSTSTSAATLAETADLSALLPLHLPSPSAPPVPPEFASAAWEVLRNTMWEEVGVVRSASGMRSASARLGALATSASGIYEGFALSRETVELRNAVQTGAVVAGAAASNLVSVGAHYVEDVDEAEAEAKAQMEAEDLQEHRGVMGASA